MKQNIILILTTIALLSFGALFAYELDMQQFTPTEICDEEQDLEVTSDNSEDIKFLFAACNYSLLTYILFFTETFTYKMPTIFSLLKPPREILPFS